eukprot:9701878-Lingulodinium_polyedra.AAC.1
MRTPQWARAAWKSLCETHRAMLSPRSAKATRALGHRTAWAARPWALACSATVACLPLAPSQ